MRDPPNATAVSKGNVRRGEPKSVRSPAAGLMPRALRVQLPEDDPPPVGGIIIIEKFARRFVRALLRALAAWPT